MDLSDDMLLEKLEECSSLNEFRTSIKLWIPENCTYRLCKNYVQGFGFYLITNFLASPPHSYLFIFSEI